MPSLKTACAVLVLIAFAGGAVAADTSSMSTPKSSAMAMSKHDTKMMQKCQAMSHDAMMKNHRCARMMKMHPDMMSGSPAPG